MITLRPYQREAKRALAEHLGARGTNPCIVLPTGSGKSLVIASCLADWASEYGKFRCIVLAHRRELVQQNYDEFMSNVQGMRSVPQCEVGVFCSALKRRDYDAQLMFASIDSVYRKAGEFPPFDCILVDEAHRIPPKGEGKYLTFLNGCRRWNNKLVVVGLTATPFRMGSGPLCHKDHLLQEVCYEVGVSDLIDEGYLCKLRSKVGESTADLSEVKKRGGEYAPASLSKATNRANLVEKAVGEIIAILAREKRKSVLIFCVDVEHCHMVSQELARYGIRAPAMTGKTPHRERDRIGNDFKDGRLCCVCNVNVYTEGFNATRVDCIVLLRPTMSPGLYSQMVGRGLRTHPGKEDCLILDYAHCIEEHGPIDLLGGGQYTVMAVCGECRESFSRAIRICPRCGWEIPKVEMERLESVERQRRMHDSTASSRSILSNEPETLKVDEITIGPHYKEGSETSMVVRYRCGLRMFREWICLEHKGYAGRKAVQWWRKRFGDTAKVPTVTDAVSNLFTCSTISEWTRTISVRKNKKHFEIVDYNQPING